jgi:hypothetical protein
MSLPLDQRPVIVALAGPNGAGKTTFYHAHLQPAGLRFVNADVLAKELDIEPYAAARVADALRKELVKQRESFVFETVFSDPAGEKLQFLKSAAEAGTTPFCALSGLRDPRCPNNAWRCVSRRADTMFRRRSWSGVFHAFSKTSKRPSATSPTYGFSTTTTSGLRTASSPSLKADAR